MDIEVVRPGFLTTLQDLGRTGHAAEGFPECGACDKFAYALTQVMAGNGSCAALECTVLGPTLRFSGNAVCAISMNAKGTVNGIQVDSLVPLFLRQGDELTVSTAWGIRAYIAIYGGMECDEVLGSCSTDLKCRLGGYEGRALRSGDHLKTNTEPTEALYEKLRARALQLEKPQHPASLQGTGPYEIHVIPGPQEQMFTEAGLDTFFGCPYTVTKDINRMGMRLEGSPVETVSGSDILSDGILEGNIQISSNGQPIIMLADHQTTGGYAKIGTVIPTDIPILAQLQEGCAVRFVRTDRTAARDVYLETAERIRALEKGMNIDDEQSRFKFGFGRKLRNIQTGDGQGNSSIRDLIKRCLRFSRR